MTRVEFEALVTNLEKKFGNDDERLKKSSLVWAVLGYCVLTVYIMLCLAIVAGCVWLIVSRPNAGTIKLGLFLGIAAGALAVSILKSLWVSLSAPEGRELTRDEAPKLFEMIDSISEAAGGVVFHKVLVTDEFNASVVQIARAGVFGFYRNYLSLGLPLMDALPPEEFKSVLAHEFSHLSGADGKVSNWIYRIRQTWERVADEIFEQGGWLNAPLRGFFSWFWPRFNGRAFLLSRANEYRADGFSAEVTSPNDCARALHRIHLQARNLEDEFWFELQNRLRKESEPPSAIYVEMLEFLDQTVQEDKRKKWLEQAYFSKTNHSDTHPSLKDRCVSFGVSDIIHHLPKVTRHASEAYLGESLAKELRIDFSKRWAEMASVNWKAQREEIEESKLKLQKLEEKGISSSEDEWSKISLLCEIDGLKPNFQELKLFADNNPDHHLAAFITGAHLLSEDDASGLNYLERAATIPDLAMACMEQTAGFHDRNGDHGKLDALAQKADEHDAWMNKTDRIRNNVTKKDSFVQHGLSDSRIDSLRMVLSGMPKIKKAWLVRRVHEVFGATPHFLLVIEIKQPFINVSGSSVSQKVINLFLEKVEFEDALIVIDTESEHKAIRKKVAKIPDCQIYQK